MSISRCRASSSSWPLSVSESTRCDSVITGSMHATRIRLAIKISTSENAARRGWIFPEVISLFLEIRKRRDRRQRGGQHVDRRLFQAGDVQHVGELARVGRLQ